MTGIIIRGGRPLNGMVGIQGSKNTFLHLAATALLADNKVRIFNVPRITDAQVARDILTESGAKISTHGRSMTLAVDGIKSGIIPTGFGNKIRPTACFGAALLARTGRTEFPTPGGDSFTPRGIDLHLRAMQEAGADVRISGDVVSAETSYCLRAFSFEAATHAYGPSLGATVTSLILAARARGTSRITNASFEPEVTGVLDMLSGMGVPVRTIGTTIEIDGRDRLEEAFVEVPPDRMVAGTFAIAAAATDGQIELDVRPEVFPEGFASVAARVGLILEETCHGVRATRGVLRATSAETGVHPAFPTDLQPQLCTLLCLAPGRSWVGETIYAERSTHIEGLAAFGSKIQARRGGFLIHGPSSFRGASVRGVDIRSTAALVIAGLAAHGRTEVLGMSHIRRGYDDFPGALRTLGADISEEKP